LELLKEFKQFFRLARNYEFYPSLLENEALFKELEESVNILEKLTLQHHNNPRIEIVQEA